MRRMLLLGLFAGFSACSPADSGPARSGTGAQGASGLGGQSGGGGGGVGAGAIGGSNIAGGGAGGASGGASGMGGASGAGGSAGAMAGAGGASGIGGAGAGGTGGGTAGSVGTGVPSGDPILDRLTTKEVAVPAGAKAGTRNWRIWDSTMLKVAPVYSVPLANCGTLVCYTSGSGNSPNAHAVRLDSNDALAKTVDLGAGLECRGIAAEPDGHFAALLWKGDTDQIWIKRYDLEGTELFATELKNDDNNPTDFGLGEARMEFGDGKYGAYYHVHSDSGHEGDTLKYVAAATGMEETQWSWGCSHSMSNLLTYNATAKAFLATCVTDCYPGTMGSSFATTAIGGIYLENRRKVLDVAAGCNGTVAGELGGAAVASSGWKLVFNAHRGPVALGQDSYDENTMNQDIALASVTAMRMPAGEVVWLTDTPNSNEADSAMARWQPAGDDAEQYIVGWLDPEPAAAYKLSRVAPDGKILEGPIDVTAKARWGQRDDPFRAHVNGDIVWAWFEAAGATTLKVARLRSDGMAQCAAF